jgi:ribose 5-phosphate isomerase A
LTTPSTPHDSLKRLVGEYAVQFITSGMVVGLGHGSTAIWSTRTLAERIHTGALQNIVAIPCSKETEREALVLGIPLTTFAEHPVVDVTIDGADEVDPQFQLIKGGGGALLREKIVAQASRRQIIVIDESKLSPALGTNSALPVEVIPFGWRSQVGAIEGLGATWTLRLAQDGSPFVTDQQNYILDCRFPPMNNPHTIANALNQLATVVETGLFLDIATDLIIGRASGVEHRQRS